MNDFPTAGMETQPGDTSAGITIKSTGIQMIFRSLVSIIGMGGARIKQCPFCSKSLPKEARTCRFCNRILMLAVDLGSPKKSCVRILK